MNDNNSNGNVIEINIDKLIELEELEEETEENERKCTKCNIIKKLNEFSLLKSGKKGRNSHCRLCRSNDRKTLNYEKKTDGTKLCFDCEQVLDVSNFNGDKSSSDGLQTYCKDCKHARMNELSSTLEGFTKRLIHDIRNNNKKRAKDLELSITHLDIIDLYNKQKGKCALTGKILKHNAYNVKGNNHIINNWNISVDRIDSNKGYTKDNVQLVGAIINRMKTDLTDDYFILFCQCVSSFNQKRIPEIVANCIKQSKYYEFVNLEDE